MKKLIIIEKRNSNNCVNNTQTTEIESLTS